MSIYHEAVSLFNLTVKSFSNLYLEPTSTKQ